MFSVHEMLEANRTSAFAAVAVGNMPTWTVVSAITAVKTAALVLNLADSIANAADLGIA